MTAKAVQPMIGVEVAGESQRDVTWLDETRLPVDLSHVAGSFPALQKLRDAAFFRGARLSDDGFAVEWSDDVDLSGVQLWRWAHEQAGWYMPAEDFRGWMTMNRLSYTKAAQALGFTRRMVGYYAAGERPVPFTVKLATIGWQVSQRGAPEYARPQAHSAPAKRADIWTSLLAATSPRSGQRNREAIDAEIDAERNDWDRR